MDEEGMPSPSHLKNVEAYTIGCRVRLLFGVSFQLYDPCAEHTGRRKPTYGERWMVRFQKCNFGRGLFTYGNKDRRSRPALAPGVYQAGVIGQGRVFVPSPQKENDMRETLLVVRSTVLWVVRFTLLMAIIVLGMVATHTWTNPLVSIGVAAVWTTVVALLALILLLLWIYLEIEMKHI